MYVITPDRLIRDSSLRFDESISKDLSVIEREKIVGFDDDGDAQCELWNQVIREQLEVHNHVISLTCDGIDHL